MRIGSLLILLLLAACGGEAANNAAPEGFSPELMERAKPAERNLTRLRDAVVKYYAKNKEAPASVNDLAGFGGGPDDLETNEDYSDVGFTFLSGTLKFNDDGSLKQGWFIASPKGKSDALQVRMNGVTGTFDYIAKGEKWKPSPEEEASSGQ